MSAFPEDIRRFYQPVQPTVLSDNVQARYRERNPDTIVRSLIACYWELKSRTAIPDVFNYRVIADGCIDVYFDVNNAADSYVMGFSSTHTTFALTAGFHYFGIRFLPGAFPFLSHVPALPLSNGNNELSQVWPLLAKLIRKGISGISDADDIARACDKICTRTLLHTPAKYDDRAFESIALVLSARGAMPVNNFDVAVSPRHLRRLFEYYVGAPPKRFSKVVRFQHFLTQKPTAQTLRKDKPFFDAGYNDQAHFIRDFTTFFGDTPSKALRAMAW